MLLKWLALIKPQEKMGLMPISFRFSDQLLGKMRCAAIQVFFQSWKMLKQLNVTLIVFVPKPG